MISSYPNHTEISFIVHPQVTSKKSRPCIIYQQIDFNIPTKISFITFRNFYCAAIIIKQNTSVANFNDDENSNNYWDQVIEQQLMCNPNYEDDAQNYHSIELNTTFIKSLRFYLQQPSPNWRSFGLNDVKCYSLTESQSISDNLSTHVFCNIFDFIIT